MNRFVKIWILCAFILGMNFIHCMKQEDRKGVPSELYDAVFNSHLIKQNIPGNSKLLSEAFKNFLSSYSLHTFSCHAPGETSSEISAVHFSPDGTQLLTVSMDRSAKVWDTFTGDIIQTFRHDDLIDSAEFSLDGSKVLTGSRDCTAKLWDSRTGDLISTFNYHPYGVRSITLSPDGSKVLAICWDKDTALLSDVCTKAPLKSFNHDSCVTSAYFNHDGTNVLTCSRDEGAAKLWNTSTGNLAQSFQHENITFDCAVFSPDGSKILTSSSAGLLLWNANPVKHIGTFANLDRAREATFSSDGRFILLWNKSNLTVFDANTRARISSIQTPIVFASAILNHDGSDILAGSIDGSISLWYTRTGIGLQIFTYDKRPTKLDFNPDGTQVVVVYKDTLILCNLSHEEETKFPNKLNLNQCELLQAFERAIKDRGRIHIDLDDMKGCEYSETFKSFPIWVRRKLARFVKLYHSGKKEKNTLETNLSGNDSNASEAISVAPPTVMKNKDKSLKKTNQKSKRSYWKSFLGIGCIGLGAYFFYKYKKPFHRRNENEMATHLA